MTVLHVQLLLTLAEDMSGGHTSLDKLIQRIMIDAQDLIKCSRCNVFVFDSTRTEQVFSPSSRFATLLSIENILACLVMA